MSSERPRPAVVQIRCDEAKRSCTFRAGDITVSIVVQSSGTGDSQDRAEAVNDLFTKLALGVVELRIEQWEEE